MEHKFILNDIIFTIKPYISSNGYIGFEDTANIVNYTGEFKQIDDHIMIPFSYDLFKNELQKYCSVEIDFDCFYDNNYENIYLYKTTCCFKHPDDEPEFSAIFAYYDDDNN